MAPRLASTGDDDFTVLTRKASLELMNPSSSSPLRKTTLFFGTFNLVATIVGGGVLSLPLAFAKAGIGLATVLMVFAAVITDFSLYILCCCARRTGVASYIDVVRFAFGPMAEICVTGILWTYLSGMLIAFNVLMMGIFAPLARRCMETFTSIDVTGIDEKHFDSLVLLGIIVLIFPLMLKKNLYALRHICYVGFTSVCVIAVSIGYRAYQRNTSMVGTLQIKFVTDDWTDALYCFPIIVLAFLCSFNVVEVQGSLENPTRERVKSVIHRSVASCFVLFQAFGLGGYFYAYDACRGNIFLNFDPSDPLIIVGRLGMGLTLMFATPISLLPCREAFMNLIPQLQVLWSDSQVLKMPERESEVSALLDTTHTTLINSNNSSNMESYSSFASADNRTEIDVESSEEVPTEEKCTQDSNPLVHFLVTMTIATYAFIVAISVPGVAVVWSILGSSLGMIIGFIVPAACYLRIRGGKGLGRKTNMGALALLVVSITLAIVCTIQAINGISTATN